MDNDFKIFTGSAHPELGESIAKALGKTCGDMKLSKFSCNEYYAKINETIRGKNVYIVQSAGSNVNDDFMELFVIMDSLRRSSAKTINVVMPHFGYARQDKKSAPREPISARLMADLLSTVGLDRLVTVDLHADQIQGFFNKPVDHLTAMPLFIEYFKSKNIKDLVVVAPDTGRAKFSKKLSDKLGADLAIMHKTRPSHNVAEIVNIVGDVKDKTVLLVDDMVDTGGSIVACLDALKTFGCNEDVYLASTHAVFSGPAVDRLSNAKFKEVVVTDTFPIPEHKQFEGLKILETAPLIAEAIRRNLEGRSISSLVE